MSSEWESRSRIEVVAGKIQLPPLPAAPGLYRLQFDANTFYFGEATNIERRIGDYVKYYASTGIEGELRIHNALMRFNGADVAVLTGEEFGTQSARRVREHQEIKNAREAKHHVLNGGSLEERIAFHESEVLRLRAKLAKAEHRDDLSDADHLEMLDNPDANALADHVAQELALELGFSKEKAQALISRSNNEAATGVNSPTTQQSNCDEGGMSNA